MDRLAAPSPLLGHNVIADAATDPMGIVVLLVLFSKSGKVIDAILRSYKESEYRTREYLRAKYEYTQIVRHRMMNPITVIDGAAKTLQAGTTLDSATRAKLLAVIVDSAAVLMNVTLEPEQAGLEERGFDAIPRDGAASHAPLE